MKAWFSVGKWIQSAGAIVVVGLVVAGLVGLRVWTDRQLSGLNELKHISTFHKADGKRHVVLEGFSTVKYTDDGKLASRLKLKKCELCPQASAFWLFNSDPVLAIHGVQVDLFHWRRTEQANSKPSAPAPHDESGAPAPTDAIESLTHLPRQLRWGPIGRLDIRNVSFDLYEDDQRDTEIRAQQLTPGSCGELTLEKAVSVSTRDGGRQLTSNEVIWWPHFGILAVKGSYQLTEADHSRSGERTIFNLSLEPVTNQQEISSYEQRIQQKAELNVAR